MEKFRRLLLLFVSKLVQGSSDTIQFQLASTSSAETVSTPTAPSAAIVHSLERNIKNSMTVLDSTTEHLANIYMDTITKKTIIDQHALRLQAQNLHNQLAYEKLELDHHRTTITKLRKEHDLLRKALEDTSGTLEGPPAARAKELSLLHAVAYILPLVAIILLTRIITSDLDIW